MSLRSFEGVLPVIENDAYIDEAATVIGDVHIGAESSVWPGCVLRGDVNHIRIGTRTNIQDGSILHVSHGSEYYPQGFPLLIGDEVTVGHGAVIHACSIGDRCLIGMGSIVLDGAVLEGEVMLGAGSLVAPGAHLEAGYLWLGSPARRVRKLSDKEKDFLHYSAEHYVSLKNRHLSSAC
jgi:carbonic anhydrase/acetyltransferase-like protein (isoleucine patch superfamily)